MRGAAASSAVDSPQLLKFLIVRRHGLGIGGHEHVFVVGEHSTPAAKPKEKRKKEDEEGKMIRRGEREQREVQGKFQDKFQNMVIPNNGNL